jgi:hypothetical protein
MINCFYMKKQSSCSKDCQKAENAPMLSFLSKATFWTHDHCYRQICIFMPFMCCQWMKALCTDSPIQCYNLYNHRVVERYVTSKEWARSHFFIDVILTALWKIAFRRCSHCVWDITRRFWMQCRFCFCSLVVESLPVGDKDLFRLWETVASPCVRELASWEGILPERNSLSEHFATWRLMDSSVMHPCGL